MGSEETEIRLARRGDRGRGGAMNAAYVMGVGYHLVTLSLCARPSLQLERTAETSIQAEREVVKLNAGTAPVRNLP